MSNRSNLNVTKRGSPKSKLALALFSIASVLTGVGVQSASGDDLFGDPIVYPMGGSAGPKDPTACDFDGDGWMDVALVQTGYDRVAIRYNDGVGFGALGEPDFWEVGPDPVAVVCADVDQDDDPDLVVANLTDLNLSVLRNEGSRVFTHLSLPLGGELWPRDVIACNFDDDDIIDLATTNSGFGVESYTIFMGLGKGQFATAVTTPLASGGSASIRCDDLNGDTSIDLAIVQGDVSQVLIVAGNDDGTFATPVEYSVAEGPKVLAICDVDDDEAQDIVVNAVQGDSVSLLRNNGDGTFAAFETIGGVNGPAGVVCHDVDQDGDVDVLGGEQNEFLFVFRNQEGTGSFLAAELYQTNISGPSTPALAFLDDDCLPDALIVGSSNELAVLRNGGAGVGYDPATLYTPGLTPVKIIQADLNGDDAPDLITANGGQPSFEPSLSLFMNDGASGFSFSAQLNLECTQTYAVTAADFDGDQDIDLAATCRGPEYLVVFRNNGDGSFGEAELYPSGVFVTADIVSCDVNGDGRKDILVLESGEDILIFPNNEDDTFGPYSVLDGEPSATDLACMDLNQDGSPDLALSAGSGSVTVFYNDGTGEFQVGLLDGVGNSATGLASCDVNGDLLPDLLVADDDGVSILINIDDGGFAAPVSTGGDPRSHIQCCDTDSDGDNDLVVDVNSSFMTVLRNNGTGSFQEFEGFFGLPGLNDLVCADLNLDGSPDVATPAVAVSYNTVDPLYLYAEQPQDQTVVEGCEVVIEAAVDGKVQFSYQWFKDGAALIGAASQALVIESVSLEDAGDYTVQCTSGCFGLFSMPGMLTVVPAAEDLPADFDGDGSVNAFDLAQLLGSWGPCVDCPTDINGDGEVDAFDLALLLGSWGPC